MQKISELFRQLDVLSVDHLPQVLSVNKKREAVKSYKTVFGACASLAFVATLGGMLWFFSSRVQNVDYATKSTKSFSLYNDKPDHNITMRNGSFIPYLYILTDGYDWDRDKEQADSEDFLKLFDAEMR